MITFIHTADIHFGMENYGKIDPQLGIHTRLLDFQKALNACIDYAIDNDVDFFLFAGDAYKTTVPSPTQQKLLLKCFLRLQKAHIPLVIVIGNHDNPLSFGKANTLDIFNDLPLAGFHVVAKPSSFILKTKSGPIQIVGIPWPTRTTIGISQSHISKTSFELADYISQTVAEIIRQYAEKLDPSMPAVLTGHLTVSSGIFSGSEKRAIYGNDPILLPSQLAIKPFDYVALGHLHRHQNLNINGYPAIVYSGSPERIDFGERNDEKGFCVVTIREKDKTEYSFIKTPVRPFFQVDVHLKQEDNQTEKILETLSAYTLKDSIVKIVYYLPENTKDTVNLSVIQKACEGALELVAIVPVHRQKRREKRSMMNVDMDLETMLNHYFDSKDELKNKKYDLMAKISHLQEELAADALSSPE